jgi:uncharacterized protein YfdQ (DUF2303 family)
VDNEGVKEIGRLAANASSPQVIKLDHLDGNIEVIATRDGHGCVRLESAKKFLAEYEDAPERRTGTAKILTLQSFIDLMNRHKDADSAIFGLLDAMSPSLLGVIDYHTTDHKPRFGAHRISYSFPISTEWKSWQGMNSKSMGQGEWAAFVEERIADLSSPTLEERDHYETLFQTKIAEPSELIQLSRGMAISVEARVKETRVLQSGESEVIFEEVHKDGAGQKLIVPGLFIINIPLFLDGKPTRVLARLRYRRAEGRLTWFYQLYRPDIVMRDALHADLEQAGTATGLPIFEGSPEA